VIAWDVVNEAFANSDNTVSSRKSIWSAIGSHPDDYIAIAFRTAHAADPDATLCLNDYSDSSASRTDAVFKYIKNMKESGIPIDCYGIQMHIGRFPTHHYTDLPSYEFLAATYRRFASIGVQVQITELDFSEPKTGPDLAFAASYYRNNMRACIEAPNCTALNLWDFSAKYSSIPSWWPGPDYAPMMPWDAQLQPTAIFDALYGPLEEVVRSGSGSAVPGSARPPTSGGVAPPG
jgi:endo-1,4-beta-xylanase